MDTAAPQHVLILGLGASGLAMARWCARAGAQVTVADTRAQPPQLAALQQEWPQVRFVHAAFDAALLDALPGMAAVYKSPGIAPRDMAGLSAVAQDRGLPLRGELSLFAQALRDLHADKGYAPKLLAV